MGFIDRVLEPPAYGWKDEHGALIVPTTWQILRESLHRLNLFASRKHWIPVVQWLIVVAQVPFFIAWFIWYASWPLAVVGFFYSMVGMGSYGTVWLHRFGTHGAYRFRSKLARFITRNLCIRVIVEENYIISHHVHHARSDEPGDPYNANAGWLYCFLADINHQLIAQDLSPQDYQRMRELMEPTGIYMNTYEQYKRWGSVAHPVISVIELVLNWGFWWCVFFMIGGHALTCTIFGSALVWTLGIRMFNFGAHGSGKDKRVEGTDFNRKDMSINRLWPGYVAGEWHNNHHLFSTSARNGFLLSQPDLPYLYIRFLNAIGALESYRDHTDIFYERHYLPYLEQVNPARAERVRARRERRKAVKPTAPALVVEAPPSAAADFAEPDDERATGASPPVDTPDGPAPADESAEPELVSLPAGDAADASNAAR